jgi:predicted metal-dependent HD superfamily phosphohydrolase
MIAHFRALFLARDVTMALVETAVSDVYERYSENGRFYHNLHHIEAVLSHIQPFLQRAENPVSLQLAAWFHDVVYDPTRHDNEAQSAAYARQVLTELQVSQADRDEVERLIMLTSGHETSFSDLDGHILLDADLAILAAEPAQYDAYAQAIRQEYAHVPDAAYRIGRAQVLRRLRERPFLYYLPEHQNWEAAARANLARELAALTLTDGA